MVVSPPIDMAKLDDTPYKVLKGTTYPAQFAPLTEDNSEKTPAYLGLANEIYNRLPLVELKFNSALVEENSQDCKSRIIEIYVKSVEQLKSQHAEFSDFLKVVIQTNFEFRYEGIPFTEHQEKVTAQKLNKLRQKIQVPVLKSGEVLRAKNVVLDSSELLNRLKYEIRDMTVSFCQGLYDSLQQMVNHEMLGVVEWSDQHTCQFHFFREQLIQNTTGYHEKETLHQQGESRGGFREDTYRVTKTHSGRRIHRQGRYEHHLMDAQAHELHQNPVLIPEPFQKLFASIPDFMKPRCTVLEGTRFWERTIEWDYKQEKWVDEKIQDETVIVTEPFRDYDVPLHEYDPGILFDHFVLTGWGPDEIKAEEGRRATEQNQIQLQEQDVNLNRQMQIWAFFQFVILLIAFTQLNRPWLFSVLTLSALISCYPVWSFLTHWASLHNRLPQVEWKLTATSFIFMGVMMLYGYSWSLYHSNGPVFGLAVALFLAVCCLGYFSRLLWNQLPVNDRRT